MREEGGSFPSRSTDALPPPPPLCLPLDRATHATFSPPNPPASATTRSVAGGGVAQGVRRAACTHRLLRAPHLEGGGGVVRALPPRKHAGTAAPADRASAPVSLPLCSRAPSSLLVPAGRAEAGRGERLTQQRVRSRHAAGSAPAPAALPPSRATHAQLPVNRGRGRHGGVGPGRPAKKGGQSLSPPTIGRLARGPVCHWARALSPTPSLHVPISSS